MDEYLRKKLEKLDMISEAIIRIETKMEILETYDKDIKQNTKDIGKVGDVTREIRIDLKNTKEDVEEIKKEVDCIKKEKTGIMKYIIGALGGAVVSLIVYIYVNGI